MANIVRDSAFALLAIINDVLDFSKIETGNLELEILPLRVADVVEKACEMLNRMALTKGVKLTVFTDPEIPHVMLGDPGRLRQILINLASNAIKFSSSFSSAQTQAGSVAVRVMLAKRYAEHVLLEFHVIDNGIGIDEETLGRLFSPFIQADTSTTRKFGGTGLGLAISRQLANAMNGEIKVRSAPGKGSTFTLCIPFGLVKKNPTGAGLLQDGILSGGSQNPPPVAGLSCLVVNFDDQAARDIETYLLHDLALVTRTADPVVATQWITQCSARRSIIIMEAGGTGLPFESLYRAARAFPENDIQFILIGQNTRLVKSESDNHLLRVDCDLLTRSVLSDVFALAAGAVKSPERTILGDDANQSFASKSFETGLRRGSRILVAEDNDINQDVIRHQLTLLGYVADIADDGREALARWQRGGYALLLTDLHMPEMDGYGLTAAIRRAEGLGSHLPIVALTANALRSEEGRCKAAGMDGYLSKPVLLDELQGLLEKWLPVTIVATAPALGGRSQGVLEKLMPVLSTVEGRAADAAQVKEPRLAVLDETVLPKIIGDDPILIMKFLRKYQLSACRGADEIQTAIAQGDWQAAGTAAHQLKASSRSVGALALGEICERLEQCGKTANAHAAQMLAVEVDTALVSVMAKIRGSDH